MSNLGDAFKLLGDAFGEVGNALAETLGDITKNLDFGGDVGGEQGKRGFFLVEQDDITNNIINKAILNLIPSAEQIVEILIQRQKSGYNVKKTQIGKYSKKSKISKEKAEEKLGRSLSNVNFLGGGELQFVSYSWLKFNEVSSLAGLGNVDLNFSGALAESYDKVYIDATNRLGRGIIYVEGSAKYFKELEQKYGYEAFSLTLNELDITDEMLETESEEVVLKYLW